MKTTINAYEFTNEMTSHGFTRSGALALFNYLEDYEQDTEQELDFDPIGLRCEFTEYANLHEICEEYQTTFVDIDHLRESTQVIEYESGIIIQQF